MPKFQPGVSGNPAGKPVGASSYKTMIQNSFVEMLAKKDKGKDGKTYFNKYLESFMEDALSHPNGQAARLIAERLLSGEILSEIDATLHRDRREDKDFILYRIRKDCFDLQQKVLDTKHRLIMLMVGRRGGKTEVDTRKAVTVAVNTPNARVLFIGLSYTRAIELFWQPTKDLIRELGVGIMSESKVEGTIALDNGSELHFHGNTTVTERDKLRGSKWDLVIIDEIQSQPAFDYLVETVIEPTLVDRSGTLMLTGTGPKVRGTAWERWWLDEEKHGALRLNWSLADNPYIPNHTEVLAQKRAEKGWDESNPVYITEWLGKISYDDNALVYRLDADNYIQNNQLQQWVSSQPPADIHFVVGMDYGFEDSTAVALLCFSSHKPEVFLVHERKFNRSGVEEVKQALDECVMAMNDAPFKNVPEYNRKLIGFADTAGGMKMVSYEMSTKFGFNILPAMKDNKAFAIEQLQNECVRRYLKVYKDGPFADEALRVIFARDEGSGDLTRNISDEYHPDMMDAILYGFRYIWTSYPERIPAVEVTERVPDSFFNSSMKLATI